MYVFFFKQNTAYEMRISDWSSDVCSSDLWLPPNDRPEAWRHIPTPPAAAGRDRGGEGCPRSTSSARNPRPDCQANAAPAASVRRCRRCVRPRSARSEEHTSELQSLMRISYVVLCLKKNKEHNKNNISRLMLQQLNYTLDL